MSDNEFRDRVAKITRDEITAFLGTPAGKNLIRSIVIDQQKPEKAVSKKPAKAEKRKSRP